MLQIFVMKLKYHLPFNINLTFIKIYLKEKTLGKEHEDINYRQVITSSTDKEYDKHLLLMNETQISLTLLME